MSLRSGNAAFAGLALTVVSLGSAPAKADIIDTFNATGTFASGSVLSRNLSIDLTLPAHLIVRTRTRQFSLRREQVDDVRRWLGNSFSWAEDVLLRHSNTVHASCRFSFCQRGFRVAQSRMSAAPSRSVSREAVPFPIAISSTRC